MSEQPRIEYIEARRVLLDVLSAPREQLDAVVLVGAQAAYLRTTDQVERIDVGHLDLVVQTVVAKIADYWAELRKCLAIGNDTVEEIFDNARLSSYLEVICRFG